MQSKDNSLRELNSRLIAEIDKLKRENINIKTENTRLKQDIEENAKCEAEYEIKIKKLEQSNKMNINLKDKVMKLRNDIEEIKKKDQIITNTQNILSTEDILSENLE
ncbi:14334_t:CDS:1 [Cetraspora pellucida]|uniref:14334_t:CDS:1 n=1 Tax=Cetraspora pellucida TaxID=1433469 RepID=A0ACA9QCT5_9GLOM|nr:14334_t:CDS:1 [Cetraspora pellucida]